MKFSILLLFIFALLFAPTNIHAQSFSFELAPKQYEIVSQRNKNITLPYTLTNYGDPQVITLSIYTLKITDNEGNYNVSPYKGTDTSITFSIAGSNVALDSPFLIKGKNTLDFDLEISVPEGIKESDYTFSLVAEIEPQKGFENTSTIMLQGGIGSNIVLSVSDSGNLDQKGNIVQYELLTNKIITLFDKKIAFFNSGEPIPVLLIASNTGTNAVKTSGSITLISNNKNKRIEQPSFTISPQYIFSGSQRLLKTSNTFCKNNTDDICKKPHSLIIKSPFIGLYTISSVISFGENAQISYGAITFFTFPFVYATIIFLVIIILILLLPKIRRSIKK
ncbi:MAG: hypothetical protein QG570_721 [Patescibacteria group bacterium]|nr:hypothetical protein [Patescibacteria group bacterium]